MPPTRRQKSTFDPTKTPLKGYGTQTVWMGAGYVAIIERDGAGKVVGLRIKKQDPVQVGPDGYDDPGNNPKAILAVNALTAMTLLSTAIDKGEPLRASLEKAIQAVAGALEKEIATTR